MDLTLSGKVLLCVHSSFFRDSAVMLTKWLETDEVTYLELFNTEQSDKVALERRVLCEFSLLRGKLNSETSLIKK